MLVFKLVLFVVAIVKINAQSQPSFFCQTNEDCEESVGPGSLCDGSEKTCSSPFASGCLYNKLPGWKTKRVCNSDDPPDAEELGLCDRSDMDYMELRIFSGSWESVYFESWIVQIILSELLGVPTTIETGKPDGFLNFYDPNMPFDSGNGKNMESFNISNIYKDCRLASRDFDTYEYCAHVILEAWNVDVSYTGVKQKAGVIEMPKALGVIGQETLFVSKHTAARDPSLVSYLGLQGEENRHKLAQTFKRPTTWSDYCELISPDNCTTPDDVAKRPPETKKEKRGFFKDQEYTGYFRYTEKNDCVKWPLNCSGHVADYPCMWMSWLKGQLQFLNIGLESEGYDVNGGYRPHQLSEIWHAANATKSDVIMYWWYPEPVYQQFLRSEFEFQRVLFEPPTQACVDARRASGNLCIENSVKAKPSALGACDNPTKQIHKLIAGELFDTIFDPSIPDALVSPAYDVLKDFSISELQLGEIFDYWKSEPSPREAVCKWASEHIDFMSGFVPPSYPRKVLEKEVGSVPLLYVTTGLGAIAATVVIIMTLLINNYRGKNPVAAAQVEFLFLLLAGSFLISIGAIIQGLPPTDSSCLAVIWLINIGYTLELVPLIVKVSAINRLMGAARRIRRVTIKKMNLFGTVAGIMVLILIYLALWSSLDPPHKQAEHILSEDFMNPDANYTVVERNYYCASKSSAWQFAAVGWNAALLLSASVLAVQTRHVRQDFNESRTLAVMIYSHFMFVLLRVTVSFLVGHVAQITLAYILGLLFSIDTIATMIIYFVPKLLQEDRRGTMMGSSMGSLGSSYKMGAHDQNSSVLSKRTLISKKTIATTPTVQSRDANGPSACTQCGHIMSETKPLIMECAENNAYDDDDKNRSVRFEFNENKQLTEEQQTEEQQTGEQQTEEQQTEEQQTEEQQTEEQQTEEHQKYDNAPLNQ